MAVIGGIFNMDGSAVDTRALARMSRAMSARGGEGRNAYVGESAGLLWSGESEDDGGALLVIDGELCSDKPRFFGESDAKTAAERYRELGSDMGERLSGEYASAVLDREKKELLLLRGGEGGAPLFLARDECALVFATEIKGILAYFDRAASVDRTRLRSHILSACGEYGAAYLYRDITELSPSCGLVCSRLGLSYFTYKGAESEHEAFGGRRIYGGFACPDTEGMRRLLGEALYAFDYPQFDHLMPSFLRDLPFAEEVGGAVVDGTLCMDIGYSCERRDRLFALAGKRAECVPPERSAVKERELRRMEGVLSDILSGSDVGALYEAVGSDILSEIGKIGNASRRVRSLALTYQSILWLTGGAVAVI